MLAVYTHATTTAINCAQSEYPINSDKGSAVVIRDTNAEPKASPRYAWGNIIITRSTKNAAPRFQKPEYPKGGVYEVFIDEV